MTNLVVCYCRSQLKLNSCELNKKDIYANYFTILNSNKKFENLKIYLNLHFLDDVDA